VEQQTATTAGVVQSAVPVASQVNPIWMTTMTTTMTTTGPLLDHILSGAWIVFPVKALPAVVTTEQ